MRRPYPGSERKLITEAQADLAESVSSGSWRPTRAEPAARPLVWLSLQQTCEALSVSRWTINRLVVSGELKPGVHVRFWAVQPGQKRPKRQYHLTEIEKLLSRISMRHHRLRLHKSAP